MRKLYETFKILQIQKRIVSAEIRYLHSKECQFVLRIETL